MNPQVYRSGLAPRLPSMVAVCLTGTRTFVYPSTSGPAISASQFAPSSLNTDIVNYGLWLGPEDHEKTVWSKSPIARIPDTPHCWSPLYAGRRRTHVSEHVEGKTVVLTGQRRSWVQRLQDRRPGPRPIRS